MKIQRFSTNEEVDWSIQFRVIVAARIKDGSTIYNDFLKDFNDVQIIVIQITNCTFISFLFTTGSSHIHPIVD